MVLALGWLALPLGGAELIAASVKNAQGEGVVQRGGQTIPIREGMHLLADDLLRTSADGRLGIIFQDGTRISLGPQTEVKIGSFLYQPADAKFGLLLRIMRGVMTYVSGRIAQFSPDAVSVETPVCVVGLRGTHFAISIPEGRNVQ